MTQQQGEEIALVLGGQTWRGWESIRVLRSLEMIAGAFELTVTERWPGQQDRAGIKPGAPCSLTIGGEPVIVGFVDTVRAQYDAQAHKVTVQGYDATSDLVDCSILIGHAAIPDGPAVAMVERICDLFEIKVSADVPQAQTKIVNNCIQFSETAFEAISRICALAGLLPVSDGKGGLLLTNAGSAGERAAIILGENVLRGEGVSSMHNRYSFYLAAGQTAASDNVDPRSAVIGSGKAVDPGVLRFRPLVIDAEVGYPGKDYYETRARWEAAVRIGRALRATMTVRGWRDDAGALWQPNTLARVKDDFLAIDGELLISGVELTLDDEGTLATLTLTRRQAFTPAPLPLLKIFQ
jgi:prophage tail gpP-like protein